MNYRLASSNGLEEAESTYITEYALNLILNTIGNQKPECGGKLFRPLDRNGIDIFEFDLGEKKQIDIFSPNVEWGNSRLNFWANHHDIHVWVGDIHSHPTNWNGFLSQKISEAKGDLGYIEKIFEYNDCIKKFFAPILTFDDDGVPVIWSWICYRNFPKKYFYSPLKILRYREELPFF